MSGHCHECGWDVCACDEIAVQQKRNQELATRRQQALADLEAEMRRFAQQFPKALEWADKIKNLSRVDGQPDSHVALPQRRTE